MYTVWAVCGGQKQDTRRHVCGDSKTSVPLQVQQLFFAFVVILPPWIDQTSRLNLKRLAPRLFKHYPTLLAGGSGYGRCGGTLGRLWLLRDWHSRRLA